jgi:nicotinate-nucleotide adenylyltransferase
MLVAADVPEFSRGQRIGLFGGSFDPAHSGHHAVALEALKTANLDWIWWLVAPQNPLKDPGATGDFARRLEAARSIARHPRFVVTPVERALGSRNTAETISRLKPVLERGRFVWIMGADSFASLHRWRRWREIPDALPLLVVNRPGWVFRALSSPAARRLNAVRCPEQGVAGLADLCAPAWAFVTLPLREESSSAIRAGSVTKGTRKST